jgi:hypothetical protein
MCSGGKKKDEININRFKAKKFIDGNYNKFVPMDTSIDGSNYINFVLMGTTRVHR